MPCGQGPSPVSAVPAGTPLAVGAAGLMQWHSHTPGSWAARQRGAQMLCTLVGQCAACGNSSRWMRHRAKDLTISADQSPFTAVLEALQGPWCPAQPHGAHAGSSHPTALRVPVSPWAATDPCRLGSVARCLPCCCAWKGARCRHRSAGSQVERKSHARKYFLS